MAATLKLTSWWGQVRDLHKYTVNLIHLVCCLNGIFIALASSYSKQQKSNQKELSLSSSLEK